MDISEVLSSKDRLIDTVITIEGVFVLEYETGYFVQSEEHYRDKTDAIMVEYPGLTKLLWSTVPAYGGSSYSYCHEAVITGTIKYSVDTNFPLAITAISKLTLYTRKMEFPVINSP
ncbi:hypothetical protein [Herbaspirillum sp. YR522]|uniref:hypothetical protein n=1 Tax=Herbaspirillum sp. YR522 TaxID=1144342 RepID=UPI00026F6E1B|nr:hypothetical protein [Herbaspirillum sp. YR522]EJN01451.1 hypothetical protein PMI40_03312 [Herbaspirillum sp. YR522]